MSEAKLTKAELRQFTGSEQWYRHGLVRTVLFTDGAKYVADQGGAYWLLDEIALAQRGNSRVAAEEFQVWKLTVKPDRTATLTCDDGNGNVVETELDTAPGSDRGALESDVRDALKRRAVRSAASAEARLGRKNIRHG